MTTAEPRFLGVTLPMVVFAMSVLALAAAVFLAVTERWVAAALAAAGALLLFLAFAAVARPTVGGGVAPAPARPRRGLRARAGIAVESYTARSRARREITRLRHELTRLADERERRLRALGAAVYAGDVPGTNDLRAELGELERSIEAKEAEMHAVAAKAEERIQQARLETQPTEVPEPPRPAPDPAPGPAPVPPVPTPVPEPSPTPVPEPWPPPDEGTPPEPARVPEPGPLESGKNQKK